MKLPPGLVRPRVHKFWLGLECGALFLGVPMAVAARWVPVPVIPVLLVMTAGRWLAFSDCIAILFYTSGRLR